MSNTVGMRKAKEDDWISFISALKYTSAAAGKKPSWVFSYGIAPDDAEQVMSQALIAGNNAYELQVPEMTTTVGGDFRRRMFGFTKAFSPYIFESDSLATVGILFSSASRDYVDKFFGLGMFVNTDGQGDPLWWAEYPVDSAFERAYLAEHRGFVELCVNKHIPFNALVFPDKAELSSYKVLILPNIQAMSDAEASLVREFVNNGGHIIATGPNPGGWDQHGNERQEYALGDVLQIQKAVPLPPETITNYGSGTAYFFSEQIGQKYFTGTDTARGELLGNTIRGLGLVPVTLPNADRRIHVELSLLNDQLILQFTNFIGMDGAGTNGDLRIVPHTFDVSLSVGKIVTKVELASPDFGASRQSIQFTQANDLNFQVVDAKQYSMAIISFEGAQNPSLDHVPAPGTDYFQTNVNTPLPFANEQLLSNDGDLDGGALFVANVRPKSDTAGNVIFQGDGTYLYTPQQGFVGTDGFLYDLADSTGRISVGKINIAVEAPSKTYFPDLVTLVAGTDPPFNAGKLTSLEAVDDETYDIDSVNQATGGNLVEFEIESTVDDPQAATSMKVVFVGHYYPGGIDQEVSVYNFNTGQWNTIDTSYTLDYDKPVSWQVSSSVADFISDMGKVRMRVRGFSQGGSFSSWNNQAYW
eukprot:CAMPEP_0197446946 /NCGR_PEP_ID=MMETSP1175-20131217/11737_1 /TAXON_ID=1003142 /ORGANISM="Triceratium dubium, Strain CCMP147" /LENGTH=641 /DNA_ID=CAMNT_0042978123 /DNA_START=15 /DNA_END=1937 /DNA_ORIENTATION=+